MDDEKRPKAKLELLRGSGGIEAVALNGRRLTATNASPWTVVKRWLVDPEEITEALRFEESEG